MRNDKENELAKLITARLESAKEDGENITEQEILDEFGLTNNQLNHMTAGYSQNDDLCRVLCFFAMAGCACR